VTGPITGEPEQILNLPGPSWIPLLSALSVAVAFAATTLKLWTLAAASGIAAAVFLGWWPRNRDESHRRAMSDAGNGLALPLYRNDEGSVGYWAMVVTLVSDAATTAAIAFSYLYLWTGRPDAWPPQSAGALETGHGALQLCLRR